MKMETEIKKPITDKLQAVKEDMLAAQSKTAYKYLDECGGECPVEPFSEKIKSLHHDMQATREILWWLDECLYNLQSMK